MVNCGDRRRVTEVALREFLHAVLSGIRSQVLKCIEYGVTCRDVPAVTSTFLRKSLGFSDFRVRRFWSIANMISRNTYTIYEFGDARYSLLPEVRRGYLYATPNYDFFMDVFDRRERFRGRCIELVNVPSLYIYLVGGVENDVIKINALYILSLIARKRPECFSELLGFAESLITGGGGEGLDRVAPCVTELLSSWDYFRFFIPLIPGDADSLVSRCPFLKKVLSGRVKQ